MSGGRPHCCGTHCQRTRVDQGTVDQDHADYQMHLRPRLQGDLRLLDLLNLTNICDGDLANNLREWYAKDDQEWPEQAWANIKYRSTIHLAQVSEEIRSKRAFHFSLIKSCFQFIHATHTSIYHFQP